MDAESQQIEDLKALITELCDALQDANDRTDEDDAPLIQRAREATR